MMAECVPLIRAMASGRHAIAMGGPWGQGASFWQMAEGGSLNDRQRRVLSRLLEGFEGKLTTSKWAKLAKCSTDTALRDIQALVARGILVRGPAGGRSTSYDLAGPEA